MPSVAKKIDQVRGTATAARLPGDGIGRLHSDNTEGSVYSSMIVLIGRVPVIGSA